jgi:hypothetical protein
VRIHEKWSLMLGLTSKRDSFIHGSPEDAQLSDWRHYASRTHGCAGVSGQTRTYLG